MKVKFNKKKCLDKSLVDVGDLIYCNEDLLGDPADVYYLVVDKRLEQVHGKPVEHIIFREIDDTQLFSQQVWNFLTDERKFLVAKADTWQGK